MREIYSMTCSCCGTEYLIAIDPKDIERWQNGELIQNAMPYVDVNMRELIINGICGFCFDEMWK